MRFRIVKTLRFTARERGAESAGTGFGTRLTDLWFGAARYPETADISFPTKGKIANTGAAGGVAAPVREGYVFDGWALSPDGEIAYSAEQLPSVPEGTVLYAIYSAETDAEA